MVLIAGGSVEGRRSSNAGTARCRAARAAAAGRRGRRRSLRRGTAQPARSKSEPARIAGATLRSCCGRKRHGEVVRGLRRSAAGRSASALGVVVVRDDEESGTPRPARNCARSSVGRPGRSARPAGARPCGPRLRGPARVPSSTRDLLAVQRDQAVELPFEQIGIGFEVLVLGSQQAHAGLERQLEPQALAARIAQIRASGTRRSPTLRLSDSTKTGRVRDRTIATRPDQRFEHLLRRLRRAGMPPSTEPRWCASPSRSSTCEPAAARCCSRRLLPLPVVPQITTKRSPPATCSARPSRARR